MIRKLTFGLFVAGVIVLAQPVHAQSYLCQTCFKLDDAALQDCRFEPDSPLPIPQLDPHPLKIRLEKYSAVAEKHRLKGLASYYSTSLDGSLTANGERYHNKQMSAAHLTLPLGSWVEITSRATGRRLRLRVNDRGPYVNKFVIDLSQAAARFLGVDIAEDRSVQIRIIALPGEDPLPEEVNTPKATAVEETVTLTPETR